MLLDELVIRLSLDPAKFNAGTKEGIAALRKFRVEAKQSADDTERQSAKMADGFSRVTKELLGLGLAIAGANGLKGLVVGTVQAADALNLQSRALDINAESLNRWVNTARRSGVDAGAATGGFSKLITTLGGVMTRQVTPQQAGLPALQALGVSNPDWANWEHFAQQVIGGLQREQRPGVRQSLAAQIPGGDVLLQIANQFKTTGELQRALADSVTATQAQTEAARRLTEKVNELQQAFEKQVNKLTPAIEPVMNEATGGLKDVAEGNFGAAFQHGTKIDQMILDYLGKFFAPLVDAWGKADIHQYRHRGGVASSTFMDIQPLEMIPGSSGRNLPSEGSRKIFDRFPGLGPAAFASGTYQGWPSAGAHPVDMSRTIRIDQVTLMVPPGTRDPQAFADRFTTAVSAIEAQQGPR